MKTVCSGKTPITRIPLAVSYSTPCRPPKTCFATISMERMRTNVIFNFAGISDKSMYLSKDLRVVNGIEYKY